ncbi:MAG: IS1380 family transposase [Verrucomicrobia bacterium]|nr:IS1380 family transposase [Verrucomicrobiota bacterium]
MFPGVAGRDAVVRFDAGDVTSNGGVLMLERADRRVGLMSRFAACFRDHRDPERIEHTARQLVAQRVFGLCLGYEDVVDHDALGKDPLLAAACGKREGDLAGHATLSRLEMTKPGAGAATRYEKIEMVQERVDDLLADVFMEAKDGADPGLIVLDVDNSDVPLHGAQEGRFFHGYYGSYCYLPLYVFAGDHLLLARLQTADGDPARHVVDELRKIVSRLKRKWPRAKILVRGDSGFCREELMAWCEAAGHFYVLGTARNERLEEKIADALEEAKSLFAKSGRAERVFRDFDWTTVKSWSKERRVVAKAEHLVGGKSNPRFVVTNLPRRSWAAKRLYEELYCARGEAENRIKEQQLGLFGTRLSTPTLQGNAVRMAMSAMAYVLTCALRRLGLAGTDMAHAQADAIRLRLLRIGALVRITARRIWVSMSASWPWRDVFESCAARLLAPAHVT